MGDLSAHLFDEALNTHTYTFMYICRLNRFIYIYIHMHTYIYERLISTLISNKCVSDMSQMAQMWTRDESD